MPLEDLSDRPRTSDYPVPSEAQAGAMFDRLLREGKEDFDLSSDEESKFRNAFGDPKFREMLADYMDEISDPKHRAEQEAYITKLENEEQVPEGKELVRPTAAFVVKTHTKASGKGKGNKVFINIVQAEKIAEPKATQQKGGVSYSLPLSLGPKRMEHDKGGATVPTFDACFHPKALQLAKRDRRFKDLVVQTAMEHVQQQMNAGVSAARQEQLLPDYHTLKGIDYKNGTPAIMMMNKASPAAAAAAAQVASATKTSSPVAEKAAPKPKTTTAASKAGGKNASPAVKKGFLTSSGSKPAPKPTVPAPAAPPPATTPAPAAPAMAEVSSRRKQAPAKQEPSGGPATPKHRLLERGQFRASDHMNDRVQQPQRPKELELEVELPLLASAAHLELDVDDRRVVLRAKDIYLLDLKLPYPVFGEKGKAKYEKARKTLKVTMPVRPPEVVRAEDVLGSEVSPQLVAEAAVAEEEVKENGGEVDEGMVADPPRAERKKAAEDHSRWLDSKPRAPRMEFPTVATPPTPPPVTASQQPGSSEPPIPAASKERQRDPEPTPEPRPAVQGAFTSCPGFRGAVAGYVFKLGEQGLGYYRDGPTQSNEKECEDAVQCPSSQFQQNEKTISVLLQVQDIVPESVEMTCEVRQAVVRFRDSAGQGYAARLCTSKDMVPDKSRHDVADKNMIVVLYKASPGPWDDPLSVEEWVPESAPSAVSAKEPATANASSTTPSSSSSVASKPVSPSAAIGGRAGAPTSVAPTQLSSSLIFELD